MIQHKGPFDMPSQPIHTHVHTARPGPPWRQGLARQAGFSLTEILVVIAVIITLIGISFPVYRSIRESQNRNITITTIKNLEAILDEYKAQGDGFLPASVVTLNNAIVKLEQMQDGRKLLRALGSAYDDNNTPALTDDTIRDAWGNELMFNNYNGPSRMPRIWSKGPNGVDDSSDLVVPADSGKVMKNDDLNANGGA